MSQLTQTRESEKMIQELVYGKEIFGNEFDVHCTFFVRAHIPVLGYTSVQDSIINLDLINFGKDTTTRGLANRFFFFL